MTEAVLKNRWTVLAFRVTRDIQTQAQSALIVALKNDWITHRFSMTKDIQSESE